MRGGVGLLIAAGQLKADLPWLYELAIDAYRLVDRDDNRALSTLKRLQRLTEYSLQHPAFGDTFMRSPDQFRDADMMMEMLHRAIEFTRNRLASKAGTEGDSTSKSWTDERLGILRQMWLDGRPASEIANTLGGVSRNAVVGKAHRLELQSRPNPIAPPDNEGQ